MKIKQITEFDAAHRLLGYPGNCGSLHGHTWSVELEIDFSRKPDELGMLIDYRVIKQHIKDNYDHQVILNVDDPLVELLAEQSMKISLIRGNPTAENLANKIISEFILLANLDVTGEGIDRIVVRVHESKDNFAEVSL